MKKQVSTRQTLAKVLKRNHVVIKSGIRDRRKAIINNPYREVIRP
jgi:hypothetical protein